jgi:hypothetical protein
MKRRCRGSLLADLSHMLDDPNFRGKCGICGDLVPFEQMEGVWVPSVHIVSAIRRKLGPKRRNKATERSNAKGREHRRG